MTLAAVSLIVLLVLSACNGQAPTVATVTATPGDDPTPVLEDPTQVPSPTSPPGWVWLVATAGADNASQTSIQTWLASQAALAGLQFERVEAYPVGDTAPTPRIVVFLEAPEDAANLAASAPNTQFLIVTDQNIEPANNLTIIRNPAVQQAFIAGFIATLVAPDFRSGGLFSGEDGISQEAYLNGGRYLCGRCIPVYAPVVLFPQVNTLNLDGGSLAWKEAFDTLNLNRIQVLFVPPQTLEAEFLEYLISLNIKLLGTQLPAEEYRSAWVATVAADLQGALDQAWPGLVAGEGGKTIAASLQLNDVNDSLLTPGKLGMVEKLMDELRGGWIEPLSVP